MKIAIVDDITEEQEKLRGCIENWSGENSLSCNISMFSSGEDFIACADSFDIVFMDIMMNGKNGIETARLFRRRDLDALLVFITSSREFMAEAFPCHAFDYLIKPYDKPRIDKLLNDIQRTLGRVSEMIEIAGERFLISDILYVFSDSNYCRIFTKRGDQRVRISFSGLCRQLLMHPCFLAVNRGTAVNIDNTSHISSSDCIMINGDRVPVSRRKLKETEQAFLDRQFSKLLEEGK